MVWLRILAVCLIVASCCLAATFGTVVPVVGGVADLVLDEGRGRLYLVNSVSARVEVYSVPQRRFLDPIRVEEQPLSAAMSWSKKYLYVTAHASAALLTIDLDTFQIVNRVSLPAKPEGVAVGYDERVLISTVGTGPGNSQNVLLIYDPAATDASRSLQAVPVLPPAPANPLSPPLNVGRPLLSNRSHLRASQDGQLVVGVNIPTNNVHVAFVYEAASGTLLRSRSITTGVSPVLSISPDGSKFMAGLNLLETATLQVIARQNAANSPYPFPPNSNFNLQQNQGGSVFSPDGSLLYTAFNFTPVQNPPARPNVSQLMINDPDNLLIHTALQLPENLAGKMVTTSDGGTIYAISESGFLIVPMSTLRNSPVAAVERRTTLLANDQCGVTAGQRSAPVAVQNEGRGRMTVTASLLQTTPTGPGGLGGAGGAGGGLPGGGVIIIIPPPATPAQPGTTPAPPVLPGGIQTGGNVNIAATAPIVRTQPSADGVTVEFTYNNNASRSIGTVSPTHQFLIQSNEAVNIPSAVRVFQNNRNSETKADLIPAEMGLSANEGLVDMVQDTARQRLYIANSAMNRVEVFDTREKRFLSPVKVGQLPRSLAMTVDGRLLYVANSGGESVSIVDLELLEVTGRVKFPPLPFNNNAALVTPQTIACGARGPLVIMNNGSVWRIVGDEAVPRRFNASVLPANAQGTQLLSAPRTMVATPNGEYIMMLAGNNFAYLYDSNADDLVQGRQVINPPVTGYYGPVAAGPRGQYYLVNGLVFNSSLTPTGSADQVPAGPTRPGTTTPMVTVPVAAVAPVSGTTYARFVQPVRANANAVVTSEPMIEIADINTGRMMARAPLLEGPISTPTGNQRSNMDGRTMAVDPRTNTVYVLTASGLSMTTLDAPALAERPAVNPGGVVNLASYLPNLAPNGLVTVFGRNLAEPAQAGDGGLPTLMGESCLTLNNRPLPLLMTSPTQINAQIPPDLAAGRYQLVVRNLRSLAATQPQNVTISRYAPAVLVDMSTGQPAIYHASGEPVTPASPAKRDQRLALYAVGLGPTKGGRATAGNPSPAEPLAETDEVKVFFGDPTWNGSEMDVEWSGLVPGLIGIYQVNLYVPWNRLRGEKLPVTLRIGGASSPATGPAVPYVAVD